MKLLVGLGNPGEKYSNTRHNVGFMVVDRMVPDILDPSSVKIKKLYISLMTYDKGLVFVKPQTFMNNSGDAVKKIIGLYKVHPNDLYIIHDDLDLTLGNFKIQKGKGPREHKGLNSIYKSIGTQDFWHVRVGVDNRGSEKRISGEEYILQNFAPNELTSLENVISDVIDDLLTRFEK